MLSIPNEKVPQRFSAQRTVTKSSGSNCSVVKNEKLNQNNINSLLGNSNLNMKKNYKPTKKKRLSSNIIVTYYFLN